jgi:hypothetical protein
MIYRSRSDTISIGREGNDVELSSTTRSSRDATPRSRSAPKGK